MGKSISRFYGPEKKNLQGSYSSGPLCRGMRLSRTLPPPVRRTHQSYKLWLDLVFPFEGFYHLLFYLLIYFSFTRIWFILLSEPGNKGAASNHPRRRSVPLPKACTTLLGTTDLCSFVRVIPPICVNYLLLTYLHQRLFLMPALFYLLNSPIERGPISCCHSRIITPRR